MSLDAYTLTAQEQHLEELRTRNQRLIRLRWLYVLLVGVIGIGILAIAGDAAQRKSLSPSVIAAATVLLLNTVLWYMSRRHLATTSYYQAIALTQVLLDVLLASFVIYSQGGPMARATVLYAIPIIATGILFSRAFVYLTAVLCSAAYVLVSIVYASLNPSIISSEQLIPPIVFYPCVFGVIAAITVYLSRINHREIRQKSYDELLAMLTHQLRRPSSTIAAASEMLEFDPNAPLTPTQKRSLEIIKQENARSLSMLTNFIESGRVISKKSKSQTAQTMDLSALLRQIAERCAVAAGREADLKLKIPSVPVYFGGNIEQMPIALSNLITNAFQYSQSGTEVNVELSSVNDLIKIQVGDHGSGMTKKQRESQYKRFLEAIKDERLTAPTKVGLGLYVSERIIKHNGGKLDIKSELHKGSQITVTFEGNRHV